MELALAPLPGEAAPPQQLPETAQGGPEVLPVGDAHPYTVAGGEPAGGKE